MCAILGPWKAHGGTRCDYSSEGESNLIRETRWQCTHQLESTRMSMIKCWVANYRFFMCLDCLSYDVTDGPEEFELAQCSCGIGNWTQDSFFATQGLCYRAKSPVGFGSLEQVAELRSHSHCGKWYAEGHRWEGTVLCDAWGSTAWTWSESLNKC